jgi:hypothetical protein
MARQGTEETKPLKRQNQPLIITILFVNLAVLILAIKTGSIVLGGMNTLVAEWQSLIPAGLGIVISGVVNEQLSANAKARLVFWRWNDPLPGSDAFSIHMHEDPRIDAAALTKKFGPFPIIRREQNARWFRMYQSVRDEPSVVQAHRFFLLTRDYAGISFLLIIVFGTIGFWQIPSPRTAAIYLVVLVAQYLLVRQSAKNNGIRFVTTVLALKAAGN